MAIISKEKQWVKKKFGALLHSAEIKCHIWARQKGFKRIQTDIYSCRELPVVIMSILFWNKNTILNTSII